MSTDTFILWLKKQVDRDDIIGDLASKAVNHDWFTSLESSYKSLEYCLQENFSCSKTYRALKMAYEEWRPFLDGHRCLKCREYMSTEELKQLSNCPVCKQRYCKNCSDENGECKEGCWYQE